MRHRVHPQPSRATDSAAIRLSRRYSIRDPEHLICPVYAYVAYRVGDGPQAEEITSWTSSTRAQIPARHMTRKEGRTDAWPTGIMRLPYRRSIDLPVVGVSPSWWTRPSDGSQARPRGANRLRKLSASYQARP